MTRVIGIVGWKDVGKTYLVTEIIKLLVVKNYRVGSIKHAHHDFNIDKPGTDSFKHRKAGSSQVIISSSRRWAKINENMQKTNEYLVDFNNVNIEHILPQKPAKWGLDQSQVKPYVHLIGNLTLLDESYNRTIGNEPLSVKLDHLRESQLEITKDFIIFSSQFY